MTLSGASFELVVQRGQVEEEKKKVDMLEISQYNVWTMN